MSRLTAHVALVRTSAFTLRGEALEGPYRGLIGSE